jgi:hypothetical protein
MLKGMEVYQFNYNFYKFQCNYLEKIMESTQFLFL